MGSHKILRFLEAVDAALVEHAEEGERLDLHLIGRSALILRYGLNIGTRDVDIVHIHGRRLELKAVELFREGTANAERFGDSASTLSRCLRGCRQSRALTSLALSRSRADGAFSGPCSRIRTTWP